jgi:hypothetical protein
MVRSVRITALVTLWLVPILIFASALSSDWVKTWQAFGVPSMTPHFLDLYNIPTAVETLHNGGDPLVANPLDPFHRPMNYPRIWLYVFSFMGITRGNVSTVGVAFSVFYLACISYLIFQTRHALDAIILLLTSLSVAPLLALERGNTDLLVFSLVFLACIATNKYLKTALFGLASVLKIFPLAAMITDSIRRPRNERMLAALLTAAVLAVILFQWRDLSLIRAGTPVYREHSYGVLSLKNELLFDTLSWGFLIGLGWVVVLECWLAGAFAIGNAWRTPWEFDSSLLNSSSAEMFSIFGAVYVFTYAVSGSFDYRLILLLPTLPFVLEMCRGSSHKVWAFVYIALVGLAENAIGFEQSGGTIACHAATFALFIMVLAMLTRLAKLPLKTPAGIFLPVGSRKPSVHPPQSLPSPD